MRALFTLVLLSFGICYGQKQIVVDSIWVANRVEYDVVSQEDRQYVAYYDKNRYMTVAFRYIHEDTWTKKALDNRLRWDSHNSVVLGIDKEGYLHLSGNMHADPLVYYRSTKPWDIQSLEPVHRMVVKKNESRVTYPKFFRDKENNLYYSYRIGGSGSGNIFIYRYDTESKTWEDHLGVPLFQGIFENETRSAYHQLRQDDEGNYHLLWMWRWTPEVSSSHQLCYARSKDLKNWVNAFGDKVELPLRPDNPLLIVDDVPAEKGLHNSKYQLIFSKKNEPLALYLKEDAQGFSQLYAAGVVSNSWKITQLSDWSVKWEIFGSGDKMSKGVVFSGLGRNKKDQTVVSYTTEKGEKGFFTLDEKSMVKKANSDLPAPKLPEWVYENTSSLDLQLHPENDRFLLKWVAAPRSHAKSAPKIIPETPKSILTLIDLQ